MAKKLVKTAISSEELEKMWKGVNLSRFWGDVIEKVSKEADAYAYARAKSKEQAGCTVFV